MMENQSPLTSPDGSSNRNLHETWTGPPYSLDCAEEDHSIPQHYQEGSPMSIKVEELESEKEMQNRIDVQCKKEDVPSGGPNNGKLAGPLNSQGSAQEDVINGNQDEDLFVIKVETVDEEETFVMGDELCKEKKMLSEIRTDGCRTRNHTENLSVISPEEEDFSADLSRGQMKPSLPQKLLNADLSSPLHTLGKGLRNHSPSIMHPSAPYPDQCFSQRAKLNSHQTTQTSEQRYACSECGKVFVKKFHLVTHQRIHTGEKPYSCSVCGKCFPDKANHLRHERIHTGDQPFSCSYCGKSFKLKAHMVIHQRTHTGEKPYSCSICGRCFTQQFDVVKHQRVHTGEKPYSCSECGKCFTEKSALVRHERVHTGVKPYFCAQCGKSFAYKSVLVNHQRNHTGEMPFSCSECGKCFRQKSVLVTHQRTHTGVKPFSCSECGKSFSRKLHVVSHQRLHR